MQVDYAASNLLIKGDRSQKKKFWQVIKQDLTAVLSRDPAARNWLEVSLLYPGLHALWGYRVSHWFWSHHFKLVGRWISQLIRNLTGIEIHPGALIGQGLFIDHGMGVVIGETAEIGNDVTLYHGVTLGGTSSAKGKRHPTLGDRVVVGAGAKVLGAITIGEDTRIGANAVVVKSMPSNSVVVGVPGQVVKRSQPHHEGDAPDLNHTQLPDILGVTIRQLLERVDSLEERSNGGKKQAKIHIPIEGTWDGHDFII